MTQNAEKYEEKGREHNHFEIDTRHRFQHWFGKLLHGCIHDGFSVASNPDPHSWEIEWTMAHDGVLQGTRDQCACDGFEKKRRDHVLNLLVVCFNNTPIVPWRTVTILLCHWKAPRWCVVCLFPLIGSRNVQMNFAILASVLKSAVLSAPIAVLPVVPLPIVIF